MKNTTNLNLYGCLKLNYRDFYQEKCQKGMIVDYVEVRMLHVS